MKLLLGTHNPGKQAELRRILTGLTDAHGVELELVYPDELPGLRPPEETGASFEANAWLKAQHYCTATGLPTVADDGGLEIAALGGAPGVLSRRWAGFEADDETLIDYTLQQLRNHRESRDRRARLRTCLSYARPATSAGERPTRAGQVCESIEGTIATAPTAQRIAGYPYRSLFIVAGLDRYYDELSPTEHAAVNHRERALTKLFEVIARDARAIS
jgi:XTP/dITP diphosphohydrolase